MNRTLGLERTFVLGQYKNLKVSDTITDIPQDLMSNLEVITALRFLQLLQVDKAYLLYLQHSATLKDIDKNSPQAIEELIEDIDKARVSTFEQLKEAFASQTITEEKTKDD